MTFHVAVFGRIHPSGLAQLRDHPKLEVTAVEHDDVDQLKAVLPKADALTVRTAPLGEDLLALAPGLKIVAKHGIGTDNIAVEYLSGRNIPVALAIGANDRSVAEHALTLILACAKRLPVVDQWVRKGEWNKRLNNVGRDVEGQTLLIIGLGRIGRQLARMANAIDMNVLVHDPFLQDQSTVPENYVLYHDLHEALAAADYVSIHTPLTPDTRNLIDETAFSVMKPGACLVDCARGHIVDEAALVHALDQGHLAFAGMDVFAEEPPAPDHPLLTHERVILSPHSGALTEEGAMRMSTYTARNVIDGLFGTLRPEVILNQHALT